MTGLAFVMAGPPSLLVMADLIGHLQGTDLCCEGDNGGFLLLEMAIRVQQVVDGRDEAFDAVPAARQPGEGIEESDAGMAAVMADPPSLLVMADLIGHLVCREIPGRGRG